MCYIKHSISFWCISWIREYCSMRLWIDDSHNHVICMLSKELWKHSKSLAYSFIFIYLFIYLFIDHFAVIAVFATKKRIMLNSSRPSVNSNAYWYFFLSVEFERQSNYRVRKDEYLQKSALHGLISWRNPRTAAQFAGSGALGYKHLRQCFICHAQSWGNKNNQKLTVFKVQ